jgi:hypothetical protein
MSKKNFRILIILPFIFFYASCASDDEMMGSVNDPVSEVPSGDEDSEAPDDKEKFSLTIDITPENSGLINVSSGSYESGTSLELEATPNSIYRFKEWQGDLLGNKSTASILIDGDKTITAVFEINDSDWTYVPDDNFEKALIALGYDDLLDDYVLTSNITEVGSLYLSSLNIRDLTGIEGFKSLSELMLYNNEIVSLDLTKNTALTTLDCRSNRLTNLDLSKNLNLTRLSASFNQLTELDLTQNTLLNFINVGSNLLKTIDLTQNKLVIGLDLMNNQLTSIDLTQNILLKRLWIFDNQLASIDLSKNISLENFVGNNNQLTSIDLTKNISIENFFVNNNKLSSLDLSKNVNLRVLACTGNEISNLDLAQNIKLTNIYCSHNRLASLDISTIPNLFVLHCNDNQLTTLNLRNGNNSALRGYVFIDPPPPPTAIYVGLDATNNPLLNCIQVDDLDQVNSGEAPFKDWKKDDTAVYSENCD